MAHTHTQADSSTLAGASERASEPAKQATEASGADRVAQAEPTCILLIPRPCLALSTHNVLHAAGGRDSL